MLSQVLQVLLALKPELANETFELRVDPSGLAHAPFSHTLQAPGSRVEPVSLSGLFKLTFCECLENKQLRWYDESVTACRRRSEVLGCMDSVALAELFYIASDLKVLAAASSSFRELRRSYSRAQTFIGTSFLGSSTAPHQVWSHFKPWVKERADSFLAELNRLDIEKHLRARAAGVVTSARLLLADQVTASRDFQKLPRSVRVQPDRIIAEVLLLEELNPHKALIDLTAEPRLSTLRRELAPVVEQILELALQVSSSSKMLVLTQNELFEDHDILAAAGYVVNAEYGKTILEVPELVAQALYEGSWVDWEYPTGPNQAQKLFGLHPSVDPDVLETALVLWKDSKSGVYSNFSEALDAAKKI